MKPADLLGRKRAWLILFAVVLVLPFVLRTTVATEMWIYAILALAFNLLLGYTGLLSFGQAIFLGTGAYAAGYLILHYKIGLLLAMLVGTGSGALAALIVGYFCIQRVGIYFIMLSFSFNLMAYFIAYQATPITGGADGMTGVTRPDLIAGLPVFDIDNRTNYYILVSLLFLACAASLKWIVDSPLGRILQAIRENQERAAALGYNVQAYKRLAFTISGAYSGLAGVLYAALFQLVPIDLINWFNSGNIVFMTLIGGVSNFFGPIIGAIFFIWLQETVSRQWDRWPLLVGIVFSIVIFFFRGGIVEAWDRLLTVVGRFRAAKPESVKREAPYGTAEGRKPL
ncbi:MAG: branched-chain amino acid ABC transporter permease [Chloroflexi bacterium]|nr:branched-chain amino acid ABC transporter permease [Chloroflexota bacterium]